MAMQTLECDMYECVGVDVEWKRGGREEEEKMILERPGASCRC